MAFAVGKRVVAESESTDRRPRSGVVEEVLKVEPSPRYRIRWDDGHESIYTPSSGALRAPAAVAERVRDSVPLWFHTFALAPGIYTPGIARDHGYRLAVLGADRFAGRSVLDVSAFDGFYIASSRRPAARGALSRSITSSTSTGCVPTSA
jgi:Domain of unknown function (DUF1918)